MERFIGFLCDLIITRGPCIFAVSATPEDAGRNHCVTPFRRQNAGSGGFCF